MYKITIDGNVVEIEGGSTIFQACEKLGIEIPHFCYHKRLAVAGNCRMCLVEVEKNPKPVASCAMPVSDGMVVHTNTKKIKDAREGVMELLLINHPLDCPICDQGGECDLQDQAFKYGRGVSRYEHERRQVKPKYMGPLIATWMNRCIHCTRCIRFANDIAGVEEIGSIHRGEHMEITTLEKAVSSELSGNMIDVCPVGALTAKPIAYKYRNWELRKTKSIDIHDALGSNTYVYVKDNEIVRILPRENPKINDEWISDKARFAFDGLKYQRLDSAYIRNNSSNKLEKSSIEESISLICSKLKSTNVNEIGFLAGDLADIETMYSISDVMNTFGIKNLDNNTHRYNLDTSSRANYLFNSSIEDIKKSDLGIIIGANPRISSPVLNAFIGARARSKQMNVFRVGNPYDQTYFVNDLGNNLSILSKILSGENQISSLLSKSKYPMIIVGDEIYSRDDSIDILSVIHQISEKYGVIKDGWTGLNILHNYASTVGAIDLGFWNNAVSDSSKSKNVLEMAENGEIKMLYLVGSDNVDVKKIKDKGVFVVYQGHHGSDACNFADVIIPVKSHVERSSTYANMFGMYQTSEIAIENEGKFEDYEIMLKIARKLGIEPNWSCVDTIRSNLSKILKGFDNIGGTTESAKNEFKFLNSSISEIHDKTIKSFDVDFYMTDIICRNSKVMNECSAQRLNKS